MNCKQTPSWDSFIDALMERGYVSRAAICRIKDGKRWTSSPGFDIPVSDILEIAAGFEDGGCKLRREHLKVGPTPYTLTRVNNTLMVGRQCKTGSGCIIYRCNTCFIIAAYDDSGCAGGCYSIVNRLGDFLRFYGY